MKLHTLKPAEGSTHKEKRIGRGEASGKGGTSTQGNKGGQSRAGYSRKNAFEGGQMPLQRRLPKRGFKNWNRVEFVALNLNTLEAIATKYNVTTLDFETLVKLNIVRKNDKVKVVGACLDGKVLQQAEVNALATLPSLDELRSKIIAVINAPATKLAVLLKEPASRVARVIAAKNG